MPGPRTPKFTNRILASLSAEQLKLLGPLSMVNLPVGRQLEAADKRIQAVYFPATGMASVVGSSGTASAIEVGMIGSEGMSGLAVIMGHDRSPYETYIQMAGTGHTMTAKALRKAIGESHPLHKMLLKYGHDFVNQTTATVYANAKGTIAERLARWLLLAHDRVEGDDVPLTHKFLALMLGVRRAGVTMAIADLERRSLVRNRRGVTRIVDRGGLMKLCKGIYLDPAKIGHRRGP